MKFWMHWLLLLVCVGCGKPAEIVGTWRPIDKGGHAENTTIEFRADGKCRLDLTSQVYEWTLSGRQLMLRRPKSPRKIFAQVDFPDAQHMDFAPLDERTGQNLPAQRLERVPK
jgi:hypothetical protein